MQYPPYWQIFPCDAAIKFGLEEGHAELGRYVVDLEEGEEVLGLKDGLNDGHAVVGFTEGHAVVGFVVAPNI